MKRFWKRYLCWLCYHTGDTICKFIDWTDSEFVISTLRGYNLYSWFILKSHDLDEWGIFWYLDHMSPDKYWRRLCEWSLGKEKGRDYYYDNFDHYFWENKNEVSRTL